MKKKLHFSNWVFAAVRHNWVRATSYARISLILVPMRLQLQAGYKANITVKAWGGGGGGTGTTSGGGGGGGGYVADTYYKCTSGGLPALQWGAGGAVSSRRRYFQQLCVFWYGFGWRWRERGWEFRAVLAVVFLVVMALVPELEELVGQLLLRVAVRKVVVVPTAVLAAAAAVAGLYIKRWLSRFGLYRWYWR